MHHLSLSSGSYFRESHTEIIVWHFLDGDHRVLFLSLCIFGLPSHSCINATGHMGCIILCFIIRNMYLIFVSGIELLKLLEFPK